MTLKSDSSQTSSRKPIKVWIGQKADRAGWVQSALKRTGQATNWPKNRLALQQGVLRGKLKWLYIWGIGFVIGIVTAVVPLAFSQFANPMLPQRFNQALSKTIQSFEVVQPADVPMATSGLAQPQLLSHAAKLAAKFGHLPYEKANPEQLILFPGSPQHPTLQPEYLHREAERALRQMMAAAHADGVWIILVSGFRDFAIQNTLFQARAQELGSAELAAKSVAPPGYSEHHTGFAVDLADGLSGFQDFAQTEAFRWMMNHAHEFGFELSFPPNNPQGVDYEPWHWRFVRAPEAATTFAAARGKW